MMKHFCCLVCFVLLFTVTVGRSWADDGDSTDSGYMPQGPSAIHKLVAGATYNNKIPGIEKLPFKNGDLAYNLFYEYHEGIGLWQIGASYAPGPSDNRFDYVITPKISLILKDRIFRLGVGALKSYVKIQDDSTWTDIYWQACAGLGIPLGKHLEIDLYADYLFKSWKKIADADTSGLAYTALIAVNF